ncbi:CHAT domain-containing protein [Luteimonas sp. SJ-92]|uniref:CHAT domain-containing protein n=1 Tax=Luteimonas salinisoli TaxID=2752307 RepID=A0A853JJ44_9GAMM|nr:CHAT domain-containing tetratricopeptide repeat protein [Luteimonas salinisoli]NZA28589.1 CHAT domain-containing protein [Luteimonas salinisoli]
MPDAHPLRDRCRGATFAPFASILAPVLAVALSLLAVAPAAQAQTAAPAVADGVHPDLRAVMGAVARMEDADTALSLAADGAALYEADEIKLDGYAYCSQAVALAERGEFRRSVQAASKALHVALQTGNEDLLAKAYRDLAIAFDYAGQLDRAEGFANLALGKRADDPRQVQGPAHKVLGDVHARRGRYPEAIAAYETALASSSDRYRPLVQASLVNALILAGDVARARSEFEAIALPEGEVQRAELDRTRGRLLLAENNPAEALALFQGLVGKQVADDEGFYTLWALDGVSKSEQALGRPQAAAQALERALAAFDRVRARFRSEEFRMGLFSDLQTVFDRAIRLHSETGNAERAFDISERSRARALLDAVADRGRTPGDATAAAIEVAALRRQLRADERVVAYHSLEDLLLAWVISPEGISEHRIALPRADLERLVDAYRDAIIGLRPAAVGAGDGIAALLVTPLGLQEGQRLIVVPHGPLHYLPFQALRVEGRYLIERHPITTAPSVSIAARLVADAPRTAPRLLAFGNPLVSPTVADPLPGSEREVENLAAMFPGSRAYYHADATKTRFVADAPGARIVHVAAHARADITDPLHSQILLADENGRQNFLEAREVLDLDLDGVSLVTLSACESGLGRVADGDEVLGFTRSFLSAGASALVASLWPVPDRDTERLMTTLYRDLRGGADLQRAMQAGQLAVLGEPESAHPFYWASFNLIGNWRLTVER